MVVLGRVARVMSHFILLCEYRDIGETWRLCITHVSVVDDVGVNVDTIKVSGVVWP